MRGGQGPHFLARPHRQLFRITEVWPETPQVAPRYSDRNLEVVSRSEQSRPELTLQGMRFDSSCLIIALAVACQCASTSLER